MLLTAPSRDWERRQKTRDSPHVRLRLATGALQRACPAELIRGCSGSQHPTDGFASEETPWDGSSLQYILGLLLFFLIIMRQRRRA